MPHREIRSSLCPQVSWAVDRHCTVYGAAPRASLEQWCHNPAGLLKGHPPQVGEAFLGTPVLQSDVCENPVCVWGVPASF